MWKCAVEIKVKISEQKLYLISGNKLIKDFPISTSRYGIGNKISSNKTPLGLHRIVSKVGRNACLGAVFKRRRNTGKIARINKDSGDLITTRILRLEGLQRGINKGKGIDSFRRGIYIHGTPEEKLIGKPASHGCIRMRNSDIIRLYRLVRRGTLVEIRK